MTRDDLVEVAARAIAAAYPHNDDPRWYRAEARAVIDAVGPMLRDHEQEYAKRQLRDEVATLVAALPTRGVSAKVDEQSREIVTIALISRSDVLDLIDGSGGD